MSNDRDAIIRMLADGETALGIEFGSTRIKAVLIAPDHWPIATGGHEWANEFVDRVWTYGLDDVWAGVQAAYAELAADVRGRYGVELNRVGAVGVSAMMHGYLAFDAAGELLVPFRTWRNTITGEAAGELTELFGFNIPQRWSIAHLYQAVLNDEPHVAAVARITTLAGYVHGRLTDEFVLGVGDASGVFPIDPARVDYDQAMIDAFEERVAAHGRAWKLRELLPAVLPAGAAAGAITEAGARLLDPTGTLQPGAPMCPPEGDAGTGMVATNAIAPRTGNVSAGTSVFAMVVLEGPLRRVHPELDLVTTPSGDAVAMVHCNNCTSDLNAWVALFEEFAQAAGFPIERSRLFELLFTQALEAEPDGGGLLAYNYLSGEHIPGVAEGRPMIVRTPESRFTLANFMRTHLFAALGALRLGMDILLTDEGVRLDSMFGHGGLFKTPVVGQRILAAAIDTPVSVGTVAGEGGSWGMAILAQYLRTGAGQSLPDYLNERVFAAAEVTTIAPDAGDVAGFERFMERYRAGLPIEKLAGEVI